MTSAVTPPMPNAPLIIWTLQRTGGTNLTTHLVQRSGLPAVPHEPFNGDRNWGYVAQNWQRDHDEAALAASLREICAKPTVIKHCVENVPSAVNRALARASVQAGFKHFFLYRCDPLDRLLSLHFAKVTGVWGPGGQGSDAALQETVLPVANLAAHERRCASELDSVWRFLQELGVRPHALAFEDLYQAPSLAVAAEQLTALFVYLGWQGCAGDALALAQDVVGKGDQGTRHKYQEFAGRAELARALEAVPRFTPL